MGKKKNKGGSLDRQRCTRCLIGTVDARLDQVMDAYEEVKGALQHYAGIEAYIRLREARMWFTELGGVAHDQNLQHTCQEAPAPPASPA